jgi:hypothetical protein
VYKLLSSYPRRKVSFHEFTKKKKKKKKKKNALLTFYIYISCRPHLSLDFIQRELAFDSREELLKFLTDQKACILKDDPSFLDTRAAYVGLVESSKKYKKIDIKGQL